MPAEAPAWFHEALATPRDEYEVDSNGTPIHVLAWGPMRGRPILLVHGNAAHAHWWSFIAPQLAAERRVLAMDLGGMGDSGMRAAPSPDAYAADIASVLADLTAKGLPPADIVAHSFGGLMSTWLAARHPEGYERLVLIDVPFVDEDEYRPSWRMDGRRTVHPSLEAALSRFRLRPAQPCDNQFLIDHIARHGLERVADGWTWKARTNPWDFEPFEHGFWTAMSEAAASVRKPPILLRGALSSLCMPAMAERWKVLFGPDVEIHVIPGSHHHIMLDQPLALAAKLESLLPF
jgi:pimeloyl-ACP methyl ester carboxylesterase